MEILSYEAFKQGCLEIAKQAEKCDVANIYGIPRGGLIVAVYLSHITGMPIVSKPQPDTLIVDDIVDSGNTVRDYVGDGYYVAVLYYNTKCNIRPNIWIYEKKDFVKFPWENDESARVDYK